MFCNIISTIGRESDFLNKFIYFRCILGGAKQVEMIKNLALAVPTDAAKPVYSDWMVVAMGVGVVFVGLVLIILICTIMGLFFKGSAKAAVSKTVAAPAATSTPIENRQEIIAAVTAACAEDMGTDVSALRVISFKKL